MFDRLEELEKKYGELSDKVNSPDIIADQNRWRELMKEHSAITPIIEKYKEYKKTMSDIKEAKEMLGESLDDEMKQMFKDELKEGQERIEEIKEELKILLLPADPNDEKNVIVEIRGGAGGDEAALFAGDLFRMYSRYAERRRWKTEIMSSNENDLGGYKEIVFMIAGKGAYSRLKYESGVHRVQRIPTTESGGRIHTSTVTVAVLPEAEDVDVEIDMNDVRVDVFRSSGNGGQSVNTTDSAVRVTHAPTGIVISCQDEKSQLKNKDKALKILRAKLYELELQKQQNELSAERRSQVGTGDRSERIRTYNFPQGRVTDHRVGLTLHRLDSVLDGDLDEIMDTLITTVQAEKLKSVNE
ncbi:peptide chain release factor 1 [Anaeropeptidivorans aminofermentans]|jgi:peptide chain release factor 1|uniref:peptide chain release factor 1 n=1 Tax=Anaeropeptidivorans aminofermentans TaxID=2934315 RepID=UPI002025A82A|nr:peptide chain release factor 1 [Anaeropeptidivorans aminofermentans]